MLALYIHPLLHTGARCHSQVVFLHHIPMRYLQLMHIYTFLLAIVITGCATDSRITPSSSGSPANGIRKIATVRDPVSSKGEASHGAVDLPDSSTVDVEHTLLKSQTDLAPDDSNSIEIYFIRHAESEWNNAKSNLGAGSWRNAPFVAKYKDAELSGRGVDQATALAEAIEDIPNAVSSNTNPLINAGEMRAGLEFLGGVDISLRATTYIATSNLRRALVTGLIALRSRSRVRRAPRVEAMHILSSLQEVSIGADARSLASEPGQVPSVSVERLRGFSIDARLNHGSPLFYRTGARLQSFCTQLHGVARKYRRMIITGHSNWLREFDQTMRTRWNSSSARSSSGTPVSSSSLSCWTGKRNVALKRERRC